MLTQFQDDPAQNDVIEGGCGAHQPIYRSKGTEITAEVKGLTDDEASNTVVFTPGMVMNFFKAICDEDCEAMGMYLSIVLVSLPLLYLFLFEVSIRSFHAPNG